jgi:hypothetical protein
VLAEAGDAPLESRALAWSEDLGGLDDASIAAAERACPVEVRRVSGELAEAFPLPDECPSYWLALHPDHRLVATVTSGIEAYRRPDGTVVVVDDSGPGSPCELGDLPADIGRRPVDPDDAGIPDDDPRWAAMSSELERWESAARQSSFARHVEQLDLVAAWRLVEVLRSGGFDPDTDDPVLWVAAAVLGGTSPQMFGLDGVVPVASPLGVVEVVAVLLAVDGTPRLFYAASHDGRCYLVSCVDEETVGGVPVDLFLWVAVTPAELANRSTCVLRDLVTDAARERWLVALHWRGPGAASVAAAGDLPDEWLPSPAATLPAAPGRSGQLGGAPRREP